MVPQQNAMCLVDTLFAGSLAAVPTSYVKYSTVDSSHRIERVHYDTDPLAKL